MSRRIPLCAWCGKSMTGTDMGKGRTCSSFENIAGKSMIGWHSECCEKDPLWLRTMQDWQRPCEDALPIIAEVNKRGPGRVS